jgi:hypothetical protein
MVAWNIKPLFSSRYFPTSDLVNIHLYGRILACQSASSAFQQVPVGQFLHQRFKDFGVDHTENRKIVIEHRYRGSS